jgi:glucosamine 6-phosphate synthetase-like amidotransferase/phosphosugar isomerase protein
MCGIVGIAANSLNRVGKNIFSDLIITSNVRGRWGAGVAAVIGDKIKGAKSLYSGCDLLDMKGFGEMMNENNIRVLLGHTRWPTKGATDEYINVHPHFNKNITGVHNGTLDKVDGEYVKGEESDSVLFYKHADEVGFKKALARISGAYCFVFIDHETKTLNFIRNRERPLFIGKHLWGTDSQSLIWASEEEMLTFTMTRAKLTAKLEIVELPPNELWSIPYNVKKGVEFTVEPAVYPGTDFWKPLGTSTAKGGEKGWPFRGGTFRGHGVDRTALPAPAKATSNVGRETYVFRNGHFVAKSSILNPPTKQVSLRRGEDVDELQREEALRLLNSSGATKGASIEQRRKTSKEVSLGNSGSAFVKNLMKGIEKHLSKEEQDFNTEQEFEKLLAEKTNGLEQVESSLWDDLQDEEDTVKYRETLKGMWVPESDYKEILAFGCAWTGNPADENSDLYWITSDTFIFRDCLKDAECISDLATVYPNDPCFNQLKSELKFKKNVSPQHITMQ